MQFYKEHDTLESLIDYHIKYYKQLEFYKEDHTLESLIDYHIKYYKQLELNLVCDGKSQYKLYRTGVIWSCFLVYINVHAVMFCIVGVFAFDHHLPHI